MVRLGGRLLWDRGGPPREENDACRGTGSSLIDGEQWEGELERQGQVRTVGVLREMVSREEEHVTNAAVQDVTKCQEDEDLSQAPRWGGVDG